MQVKLNPRNSLTFKVKDDKLVDLPFLRSIYLDKAD